MLTSRVKPRPPPAPSTLKMGLAPPSGGGRGGETAAEGGISKTRARPPAKREKGVSVMRNHCIAAVREVARRIAQPPKATFVTRLQPMRLPTRAARQLPDQSTTLRVDSSSTDDLRLRGALPQADIS